MIRLLLGLVLACAASLAWGIDKEFDGSGIADLQEGVSTIEDATRLLGRSPDTTTTGNLGGKAYSWLDGTKTAILIFSKAGTFDRVLHASGIELDASSAVADDLPVSPVGVTPPKQVFVNCVAAMEHAAIAHMARNIEGYEAHVNALRCQNELLHKTEDAAVNKLLVQAVMAYHDAIELRYSPTAHQNLQVRSQALLDSFKDR